MTHTAQQPPQPPRPLYNDGGLHLILFNRISGALAICALAVSFLMPTQGLGFDLCWFYTLSHLPCPGCGLTRSVANLSHLDFQAAWRYNPFGIVAYATMLAMAPFALIPGRWRQRWHARLARHPKPLYFGFLALMGASLFFGLGRLLYHLWTGEIFPLRP